jgi:hypothetical protein
VDWSILVGQLIGTLIGCGVGAYITGRWTETGRIDAVKGALAKVVEQETAKAFAQEQGKQDAVMTNLQHLNTQMATLTTTQEEIKARISNEVWDRQWWLNQKRDLYMKLVDAGTRLAQVYTQVAIKAEHGTLAETESELRKGLDIRDELRRLYMFARIFGNEASVEAVKGFFSSVAEDLPVEQTLIKGWADKEEGRSLTLVGKLINAAKHDLDVES